MNFRLSGPAEAGRYMVRLKPDATSGPAEAGRYMVRLKRTLHLVRLKPDATSGPAQSRTLRLVCRTGRYWGIIRTITPAVVSETRCPGKLSAT